MWVFFESPHLRISAYQSPPLPASVLPTAAPLPLTSSSPIMHGNLPHHPPQCPLHHLQLRPQPHQFPHLLLLPALTASMIPKAAYMSCSRDGSHLRTDIPRFTLSLNPRQCAISSKILCSESSISRYICISYATVPGSEPSALASPGARWKALRFAHLC